jgi:iron complex transport system substrate-binding protein
VFPLEWSDPPFGAGHWIADMIDAAGGTPVLTEPGRRSEQLSWPTIGSARADVVVFMPCGYHLDAAVAESGTLLAQPELAAVSRILAVDADGCFSRPGPRLVDGVEALAWALHPDAVSEPPKRIIAIVR